jgi:AAA15 family ATPase/GTPase
MLIEFSVGNYRSFKDVMTFSMVATNLSAKDKRLDENNVFKVGDDLSLLKSSAIYGANASGKSNLAAALRFMRQFVLNSSKETQIAEKIGAEPFRLSTDTADSPSWFEIVFILEERKYRYGFTLDTEKVVSEWLYYVPIKKEARLFERQLDKIIVSTAFKEGKEVTGKTRPNALFLSSVAQWNGALSEKILGWFRRLNIISGLDDTALMWVTIQMLTDVNHRDDVVNLIKKLDVGIDDIRIEKASLPPIDSVPKGMREEMRGVFDELIKLSKRPDTEMVEIQTSHRKYNANGEAVSLEPFTIEEHESEGTKKLVALSGPLIDTLRQGKTLFIDEMDARFHPFMTRAIVNLFNSNESNLHNAQLIFITHDTNLLSKDRFRRDQVWFAEKDKLGATHLYSLVEFKVRNDVSFGTNYINGKYGAIPFIGDLSHLLVESNG